MYRGYIQGRPWSASDLTELFSTKRYEQMRLEMSPCRSEIHQARRIKDVERENARLKRHLAGLSLENQVLKDLASGNL